MADAGFKRKLAAIPSADIEGYCCLTGQNKEQTIRILTSNRTAVSDLVQQYRGRVVDSPGEKFLLITKGLFEFTVFDVVYYLEKGDSLYFLRLLLSHRMC